MKINNFLKSSMSPEERRVIFSSSLGTMFEWYDFYLYGAMAMLLSKHFFAKLDESAAFVFAMLAFASGFVVRPIGALVFGRLGDLVGRKYTFLITILIMGGATFLIGVLPEYDSIGIAAPIILVALRLIQGLALGGEYGGAATYVAEYAPNHQRGAHTAWIQTTATSGFLLSLIVVLSTQMLMSEDAFQQWGWRIPFLLSIVLVVASLWIRLRVRESPLFKKMKEAGQQSKTPIKDAFGHWKNLKMILLAIFGLTMGQAVVWYTGQFYALFFLSKVLKVDSITASSLMACALVIALPFFLIFGALSDRIGRKPLILTGFLVAALSYIPLFKALTYSLNPALAEAQERIPVVLLADPHECSFQFDPLGVVKQQSSCDVGKKILADNAISYNQKDLPQGATASITIGTQVSIAVFSPTHMDNADITKALAIANTAKNQAAQQFMALTGHEGSLPYQTAQTALYKANETLIAFDHNPRAAAVAILGKDFNDRLKKALTQAGYPDHADPTKAHYGLAVTILSVLVIYVALVYGPIAAALTEMFPTAIRYTSMSFPYHIGNGWFGGLLPTISFAIVAQTGNIYSGLWYPMIVALLCAIVGLFLVPERKGTDITQHS